MTIPKLMMVFDVESIGLHGQGFSVGWTLIDQFGTEKAFSSMGCPPDEASGTPEGRQWVSENCAGFDPMIKFGDPYQLRAGFWSDWMLWKREGAILFAECLWPVEARFLNLCVEDDKNSRVWEGPYPFHEIASIMLAAGMDPMANYDRLENELPAHNPLADARQSARLLLEAFSKLNK